MTEYPMYIAGQEVRTAEARPVELPYDGSAVGTIYEAHKEQVDAAIQAAVSAAPLMREMTLDERSTILRRAWQALLERKGEMALAVSSETGKPIREARMEVDRAAMTLLFSSEEAHRLHGDVVPMDASPAGKGRMAITVRQPLGVIAAITPFNFPLNLAMHKIGPALAGGNTVVHKPASTTPISGILMARIFASCGLPEGALNVITGPGGAIGDLLVMDPRVAMVTFTGSVDVGRRIRNLAGMKRVTLELGSNSAVIIEDDANLEEAVPRCVAGSFAHSGQVCISVQRIFVNRKVSNEFVERMVEGARKLVLGHPHDAATDISSLITPKEAERVESWVKEATGAGARLLTGGARRRATLEPAVLADVPSGVSLSCREAFGPVVGINGYDTLEEAIARVNDSDYGLQAGIYTRDLQKAFTAARRVDVGGFMINEVPQYRVDQMPYGGVKLSGTGREGPKYAIEEMTEPKLICWKI
jgi:acyl-CoA reductase-like NAD-dependent aldehyde dehydrogenase